MEEIYEREGMDVYEAAAALAAARAAAEVGVPYQAGTREPNWYRWEGGQPSGSFERGAVMESEHHEGLQVYDKGQWHPVTGFGYYTMAPAQDKEKPPVELTQELAFLDSTRCLLEAGANMANEGKRLCRKLRAELDREDSDTECVALEVEKMLDRLNCIMNMVLEQEGVLEI